MSVGKRLLWGVVVLGLGDAISKAIGLLITIVRTRTLDTVEYGGFAFILQTVGMFSQAAGFSLGLAATRYVALYRLTEPRKAQELAQFILLFGMMTCAASTLLMLLLAPALSTAVPELTGTMRIATLVLVTQTLSGLVMGILVGMERFRSASVATISQNVIMLGLTFWWAKWFGLTGTLYAMAIGFLVSLVIGVWACRDLLFADRVRLASLWKHRSILWEYCLPSLLSGVCVIPAQWLVFAMMASQHGSEYELLAGLFTIQPNWLASLGSLQRYHTGLQQIAIFYAADQLRPLLMLFNNLVAQPMMPIVTSQIKLALDQQLLPEQREAARQKVLTATLRSFQLAVCFILPLHALLAFAGPYIMALFGKSFASEWSVFLLVLAVGASGAIMGLMNTVLQAQGRMWLSNALSLIYGVFLIGFALVLVPFGAVGLGWTYLLTTLSTFCISGTVLVQTGLLDLKELRLIVYSVAWIGLMSLCSWWMPAEWRIFAIPVACLLTSLVLFLMLREPMLQVLAIVRRRLLG